MSEQAKKQCGAYVGRGRGSASHCLRSGTVEEGGVWFCSLHCKAGEATRLKRREVLYQKYTALIDAAVRAQDCAAAMHGIPDPAAFVCEARELAELADHSESTPIARKARAFIARHGGPK